MAMTQRYKGLVESLVGSTQRLTVAIERRLPLLYLCWALVFGSALVWIVPPWQNPDEGAHLARAVQIALGGLVGQRTSDAQSGMSDPAIGRAQEPLAVVPFHSGTKVTQAMLAAAGAVRWGRPAPLWFPNTAVYPPLLYAATVPAVWIGRLSHIHVVASLRLVRLFNVIATTAFGALALAIGGRTRVAIAATLVLPQSVALAASASEDTLLIALVAVSVATIDGIVHLPANRVVRTGAVSACLLAVMLARPPYAPLAALVPAIPLKRRRLGFALALSLVAITAGWTIYSTIAISVRMVPSDPAAQIGFVTTHPVRLAKVLLNTLEASGRWYVDTMIGVLGWLDTWLPRRFLDAARWVLALALLSAAVPDPSTRPRARWLALAAALAGAAAVFASLYIVWTPVAAPNIEGVQGRYFLPLLPVLALGLPSLGRWANIMRPIALLSVVGLAASSPAITLLALIRRYYLS